MRRCTPLNHTAAMLKLSGQSDPDPQRYLRNTYTHTHTHTHTHTDRQRFLVFIERWRSVIPENFKNFECILKCSRGNHQTHDETGCHEDRPRKGRPKVTEDTFIQVTGLRNCKCTAAQIRAHINASQISSSRHISTSAVQKTLHESGLHGRIAAKKP